MPYTTCDNGSQLVICPICNTDAFAGQPESKVKDLINQSSKNRQLVTCQSCKARFILRKDQSEDLTTRPL